jgi:hypothetical protein
MYKRRGSEVVKIKRSVDTAESEGIRKRSQRKGTLTYYEAQYEKGKNKEHAEALRRGLYL